MSSVWALGACVRVRREYAQCQLRSMPMAPHTGPCAATLRAGGRGSESERAAGGRWVHARALDSKLDRAGTSAGSIDEFVRTAGGRAGGRVSTVRVCIQHSFYISFANTGIVIHYLLYST